MVSMMIEENPDEEEFENPSNTAYVNEAVEIIMQSYSKKLKISDIATKIGISRNYLTDLFKHEFDMSPQSFLMNFRMGSMSGIRIHWRFPRHLSKSMG